MSGYTIMLNTHRIAPSRESNWRRRLEGRFELYTVIAPLENWAHVRTAACDGVGRTNVVGLGWTIVSDGGLAAGVRLLCGYNCWNACYSFF